MKEIPILFSTPMVAALLAGRKTMTRRIVKMPKEDIKDAKWGYTAFTPKGFISFRGIHSNGQYGESFVKCPYGQPGDLLWVRETWAPDLAGDDVSSYVEQIRYLADGVRLPVKWVKDYNSYRNRPGIHMNKEYARIWLQKTASKVERACDISREDAIAEGLACITKDDGRTWKYGIPDRDGYPGTDDHGWPWAEWEVDPAAAFKKLWRKINGPETWESWVWVESFKVLSTTGKPSSITENINA